MPRRLEFMAASGKGFSFYTFSIRNFGASSGGWWKKCVYRVKGGSIIYIEIGLKVSVIANIRETLKWV